MTDAMLGRPSVAATFVDILRCPLSHSDLHWLADAEIEALNQQVRIGSLRHVEGTLVERALTAAVASPGNEFVYRVDDGIFFLLSNAAIRGGAPAALVTGHGLSPETESVRRFYDEFGWRESVAGVFEDGRKFEDLRPVSQNYIRNCHLRLAQHLPPRGTYLLDAASGPVQYPDYLAYSANYDFRICADVSELALRHARKKLGEKGLYLLCDVSNLPLRDGTADAFVSLHTIYHVPARLQSKAIAELYRVLKEHGAGVVVYSWGNRSPLMNAAFVEARPLQALARMLSGMRSWLHADRAGKAPATPGAPDCAAGRGLAHVEPDLFGHSHDFWWYQKRVERKYRSTLASWRSVSVPFMQRFVHARAFGRQLLALLHYLEGRFPRWFGRYGQYPIFVFTKERQRSLRRQRAQHRKSTPNAGLAEHGPDTRA